MLNQHTSLTILPLVSQFIVGRIVKGDTTVSADWEAPDDFHPDDTDVLADFERCEFLDLSRPLLPQLWHAKFSKAFYLEQVHQPRHVSYSAKLFPWPALEALTLTPWYIIPIVWGPITLCFMYLSLLQFSPATSGTTFRSLVAGVTEGALPGLWSYSAMIKTGACWSVGMFLWTILEYGFHRCLFHVVRRPVSEVSHAARGANALTSLIPFLAGRQAARRQLVDAPPFPSARRSPLPTHGASCRIPLRI